MQKFFCFKILLQRLFNKSNEQKMFWFNVHK